MSDFGMENLAFFHTVSQTAEYVAWRKPSRPDPGWGRCGVFVWGLCRCYQLELGWCWVENTFIISTFTALILCDHEQGKTGIFLQMRKLRVREMKGLAWVLAAPQ